MVQQKQPPKAAAENKEAAPSSSETQCGLDDLKGKLVSKKGTLQLLKEFWENKDKCSPEKNKEKLGLILSTLAFGYLFEKKEGTKKKAKAQSTKVKSVKAVAEADEAQEEEEAEDETTDMDESREVVCSDMRLILINCDPARKKFAAVKRVPQGDSEFLNKFGLPNYKTWKKEMISILAPDTSSEAEGVKKVTDILQWCPMGKYQCMPKYLFSHVDLPFEGEEGLEAMWQFLQSETLQRKACQGYLREANSATKGDANASRGTFYGGPRAGKAIMRFKEGTATKKDIAYLTRRQGKEGEYNSIAEYSGLDLKDPASKKIRKRSMAQLLAATAARESGDWRGKKTLARDEKWEEERYEELTYVA